MRARERTAYAVAAVLILLASTGAPAQNGGFVERTASGELVEPASTSVARPLPKRRGARRTGPRRRSRAALPPIPSPSLPVDEVASAERPVAQPLKITGRQALGQVKPIVFVEMDETSILEAVLAVGRLTQINVHGKVVHVAFSDFERFRFDYKDGMIFVSPGGKDAALVDWRKVKTDLAVVMEDGRQYHFEFVVVDSDRPSHRVINVNAPPPQREPNEDELARAEAEARRIEEERAAVEARHAEEERRRRSEALARARTRSFGVKVRRGPVEAAVADPLEFEGQAFVRFTVTNRRKAPLSLTTTVGNANGLVVPAEVMLPVPTLGPRETFEGLVIFTTSDAPAGVSLSLRIAVPGEKPVELPLNLQGK